ncbi:hypothetical protein ABPG72_002852 [Tetrahymena utriculariae]
MSKELEIQQLNQLERIINLINGNQIEKNKDNLDEIKQFLSQHYLYLSKVFRNLGQNDLEYFIKGLKCSIYSQDQLVEVQGIQSSRFGIVMKGKVKIQSSNNGKKKQYHENKMVLKPGDKIGAESMLLEKANLFSLIVETDQLVLLEIEKYFFDRCIRQIESERLESNIAFLKSTQLFKHITNDSILTMILYNSVKISFQSNEVVYSQDQTSYAIYIVLQGKFQVQQKFQDDTDQFMDQLSICSDYLEGGSPSLRKQQSLDQSSFFSSTTTLKIRTVESYEIFGEEEIMDMRQRNATVVCQQDCSEVLVIRPVIYKSCILKDDTVKKKLVELIGQKQQEAKKKEKQKREKYQSLNLSKSKKLNSSFLIQTPKNCQVGDAKESQFARQHKINQNNEFQLLNQQKSETNSIIDSQYSPLSSSGRQKKFEGFQFLDEFKEDSFQKQGIDTFGGFIKRQESIFTPDFDFLENKNVKNQNCQSACDSPLEFSNGLEVNGKKIIDFTKINKSHRILYQHIHASTKQSQSQKVDFQSGPYQAQKETDSQTFQNIEAYPQFEKINYSPPSLNQKQDLNSESFTFKSQKRSQKKIVYSYSMNNSPKLSDSHLSQTSKAQINLNHLVFQNSKQQNQSTGQPFKNQQTQDNIKFIQNYFKFQSSVKTQEQTHQLTESCKFQTKQSSKDQILDSSQIFSQSRNFPLSSENKKIRIKSLSQAGSRNKIFKIAQEGIKNQSDLMKECINRPAIIVPNSIPLQSPLSSIFSTELNLSSLQQLKQKVYQQKPLDIEKYAFYQASQKVPFSIKSQHSSRKLNKNQSQHQFKQTNDLILQTDIK